MSEFDISTVFSTERIGLNMHVSQAIAYNAFAAYTLNQARDGEAPAEPRSLALARRPPEAKCDEFPLPLADALADARLCGSAGASPSRLCRSRKLLATND